MQVKMKSGVSTMAFLQTYIQVSITGTSGAITFQAKGVTHRDLSTTTRVISTLSQESTTSSEVVTKFSTTPMTSTITML